MDYAKSIIEFASEVKIKLPCQTRIVYNQYTCFCYNKGYTPFSQRVFIGAYARYCNLEIHVVYDDTTKHKKREFYYPHNIKVGNNGC